MQAHNEPTLAMTVDAFTPWEEPGVILSHARVAMTRALLERIAQLAAVVRETNTLGIDEFNDACDFLEAEDEDDDVADVEPIRTDLNVLRVQDHEFRFEANLKNCGVTFNTQFFRIEDIQRTFAERVSAGDLEIDLRAN